VSVFDIAFISIINSSRYSYIVIAQPHHRER